MKIDLEQLKAAALAAGGLPWSVDGYVICEDTPVDSEAIGRINVAHLLSAEVADFIGAAHPAAVLALIERLERAEVALVAVGDGNDRIRELEFQVESLIRQRNDAHNAAHANAFAAHALYVIEDRMTWTVEECDPTHARWTLSFTSTYGVTEAEDSLRLAIKAWEIEYVARQST
jgi:hypothetical protein